ncbi:uncharacterized protein [Anabrus simplex]|uniref:uncharacterized protein n=1 Tax=Anabrus simplex TaxID=316456 RepID=UPI0035A3BC61
MGTSNSKTNETPRSYSSSSSYENNYGRSSSNYERPTGTYQPSAPSWETVYTSNGNTLRSRTTEHSSYQTSRNDIGYSNSYNSRSATASASVSSVSKPPPSATVASSHFSSSTTRPKPSSTPVANNHFSSSTTRPKPSSTPVANNLFSSSTTCPKPSSTPVANNHFSSSTTCPKPSSTPVANNHFSSSTTRPKPSSTPVANNPFSSTTTGSKPSSTTIANNPLTTTTGPKSSLTTIENNLFSSTTTGPKPSSTVVANNNFSSTTTVPKPLYPSLNELKSSSSVPSRQVIPSTTVVSKPLFSAPPVSSPGSQARKKEEPEVTPSHEMSDGDSNRRFKSVFKKRNDCKYYYYTKCSKGDRCDFRHEPAALGSKRVCCLWKQGKCLDEHCQFRHMNLENNKTPCCWEEKHGSCQVKECPFQHSKSEDKQDRNDGSEAKYKKENNGNKPKVHTRRRRLRHGPLIGSTSDISQLDEDEVRDSSVTQEKKDVVSLLELLQKLEEVEKNLKGDGQASIVASEPGQRSGINGDPKLNDCKYFYYSTCYKGDRCIFRHDPTSLGCKMVCQDWQVGKCNRYHCKFRHMILENNPMRCCWENKPGGCQVQDCPFQHKRSKDDVEGNNEENYEGCSKVKTENKGNNAGSRNKNRKPKHHGGKRNRSAGRPPADKEEQSTNPTTAAAVQGLSAELLQQIELKVKEAQLEFNKKLEEERANAMEKVREEHEKLANMKLEEKTKEIYEKMEDILNCSICFELFVSPVTLNCSHTFCQFCIKEWRKYEVNCPLCRKYITSEARALNIDNLIEEIMPNFPEEMKRKRENVIRQREIYTSLP